MRRSYKDFPIEKPNPIFPDKLTWEPMLQVRLGYRHAQSQRFYAYVDSGSPYCMFKSGLATLIGLDPLKDPLVIDELGGIIEGRMEPLYVHKVKLYIEQEWVIEVMAGFSKKLSVAGILGRTGFFDKFNIRFDHNVHPPVVEIDKIIKAN